MIRDQWGRVYQLAPDHVLAIMAARRAGRAFHWLATTAPTGPGVWGWSAVRRLRYLGGQHGD